MKNISINYFKTLSQVKFWFKKGTKIIFYIILEAISICSIWKTGFLKMIMPTILQRNELNKKCDFDLIETNEREQIAGIIIGVGNQKGYNTLSEDITEEWREW